MLGRRPWATPAWPAQVVFAAGLLFCLARDGRASAGTQGAAFLNIPVGAGPAALGSAYTALATDAFSPIYNPAGLGFLDSTQLAAQHLSYLESVNYEFGSFVMPLHKGNWGAVGASVQYLGSGDIPGTLPDGTPIGNFSTHYGAYTASYGKTLTDKWSAGVSGKVINAKIADVSATAYGTDVGSLYKVNRHLSLATTVTNIGSKLTFENQGDSLPLAWHLGAAYDLNAFWGAVAEGVFSEGRETGRFGLQWRPLEAIAVRAGYRTDDTKQLSALAGLTTGIGLKWWGQEFSYAWVPYGDLGATHYFSIVLSFGAPEDPKRNLVHYHSIIRKNAIGKALRDEDPEYRQLLQLLEHKEESVAQWNPGNEEFRKNNREHMTNNSDEN